MDSNRSQSTWIVTNVLQTQTDPKGDKGVSKKLKIQKLTTATKQPNSNHFGILVGFMAKGTQT